MPVARYTQDVLEALIQLDSPKAWYSQDVVEVIQAVHTFSPTTVTGAGFSQDVIEVIFAPTAADVGARFSQSVIEVLHSAAGLGEGGAPGGGSSTHSYGFAT